MTEQQFPADSTAQLKTRIESPEFWQAMRDSGITTAEAVERLSEAARQSDLDEFEALLAVHRPELWKRMQKRPSRLRRWIRLSR
ncbi:hypothetical protein [Actinacidiphila rubida]|uniref:Uncharacterized protein n=1 Tax=Actinacidiphila rubida TaxID=310780 RepID=A0A1H8SZW6_9ACTN|nr:hypothetical protein [Actinacidiphila rubida]SEO83763.1 hypothetical protein SAMN05216267_104664 [Actinacidiphila rubida]